MGKQATRALVPVRLRVIDKEGGDHANIWIPDRRYSEVIQKTQNAKKTFKIIERKLLFAVLFRVIFAALFLIRMFYLLFY